MRSTVLFNIMKSMGLDIYRLKGGYKAYRKHVIENLDKLINSHEYVNIKGYTGVGKTEILNILENSHKNVLNLEQLANHRGSSSEMPDWKINHRKKCSKVCCSIS